MLFVFFADYSSGNAAVVGYVLVSNLTTGKRKGDWDRAEVISWPYNTNLLAQNPPYSVYLILDVCLLSCRFTSMRYQMKS